MTQFPGMLLNSRFRIGELLGAGHMGQVFKAVDTHLSREVAVKILNPENAEDGRFVERFNREARIIAQLSGNPHIVTIYDIGSTGDGLPFIVTEYLPGRSLSAYVASKPPPSRTWVVEVGAQILSALVDAHQRHVIHRDLKPANIVVVASDTLSVLTKVLDFGLSRSSSIRMSPGFSTEPGTVLGTPRYMAPEVLSGDTTSPAIDVYSLGLILYELSTGDFPYKIDSPSEYLRAHISLDPQPFPPDDAPFPEEFELLVMRMLAKLPEERPDASYCYREVLRLSDVLR